MLSAERIALLKHGAPPRNALEAALRNVWYGGGTSYEKTVGPAPIISISDAKPKPAKSLIVGMEPIQDLHGYDSPWPAGGGKNLFDVTDSVVNGYVSNTGTWIAGSENEKAAVSGLLQPGTYTISKISSTRFRVGIFDSKPTPNADLYSSEFWTADPQTATSLTITTQTAGYLAIFMYNGSSEAHTADEIANSIQIESGSSVSAWTPYSNLCPITGRTGVTVDHSGADTSDPQTYPVVFPDSAGTVYGGTVDVVSGLLTVTHESVPIPTTAAPWYSGYGGYYFKNASYGGLGLTYANVLPVKTFHSYSTLGVYRDEGGTFFFEGLSNIGISTLNEFLTWIQTNSSLVVVAPLTTPQTYQLTPQQIQLLKGSNTLWSDADDLTLTYIGTTPANLLGGMLGNPQEPTEETSEEPVSEEPTEEPTEGDNE